MKSTILKGIIAVLAGVAVQPVAGQQSIIPPPGPPGPNGSGYYATLNEISSTGPAATTTEPVSVSPITTAVDPSLGVTAVPGAEVSGTFVPGAAVPGAIPADAVPGVAPMVDVTSGVSTYPGYAPGVLPAGCEDASALWANACDPRPPGLLSKLFHRHGAGCSTGLCNGLFCDGPQCAEPACDTGDIGCDSVVDSCAGLCDQSGGCQGGCGVWAHCSSVYASLLYMRARNADVAYAVPINGPITAAPANNPIQIGSVGVVDPQYNTGFVGGINLAVNCMTSLFAEVMIFDDTQRNAIATTAPNVLRSIVSHPSSTSATSDFLSGSASLELELDSVDVGLRHLFVGGQCFAVNYILGARYATLDQNFGAEFISNGTETVLTTVDFEGIGPRIGFEAERQSCHTGLRIYTRSSASFLAGRFQSTYFQGQSFDPTVVDTYWEAGRIVPVLDFELGGGWTSPNGCFRLSAGYVVSSWFNTVKTEDFIRSVQNNDFVELHDTITFDGLKAAAEIRF